MLTLEIARTFLKLPTNLDVSVFTPFENDAIDKYLRPFLGDDLIELLNVYCEGDSEESDSERLQLLFERVKAPLARFTFLIAAPSLDINIGQGGFTTAGNTNMVPASKERVGRFTESIEQLGWNGIETLLRFLEIYKSDYPEWIASDAYKAFTKGFIRSAEKFNAYVDIDSSRLQFYHFRQTMDFIELAQVIPLLGENLAEALKSENLDPNYSEDANRLKAFDLTCNFIALQTAIEKIGESYRQPAQIVYNTLKDHLNANPTSFPEKFPEGSETDRAPYPSYQNRRRSKLFEFGGGSM